MILPLRTVAKQCARCKLDSRNSVREIARLRPEGFGPALLITSGTGMGGGTHGQPAPEEVFDTSHPNPRIASELAGNELLDAGVNVSVMRLPQVHNTIKQGLISPLIAIAREKGASAYVGEGRNRWPACHLSDGARLYLLAIENKEAGARYNAVGEKDVAKHARSRKRSPAA